MVPISGWVKMFVLVFFDLCKAFVSLSQQSLLEKLKATGIIMLKQLYVFKW